MTTMVLDIGGTAIKSDHGTEFPGGETTAGEQFSAGKDRAAHPCAISQAIPPASFWEAASSNNPM